MSKKIYLLAFMVLAVMFVPVVLNFGVVKYIFPSACIVVSVFGALVRVKLLQALWAFGHLFGYLLVFYAVARVTFWVAGLFKSNAVRTAIQTAVLLALVACSFLKVITYSSLQGDGGTYHFWGAVARYFEKRHL